MGGTPVQEGDVQRRPSIPHSVLSLLSDRSSSFRIKVSLASQKFYDGARQRCAVPGSQPVSHKYRWRPVWDPNLQHGGCAQSPNSVPGFACHCSKMPEKGLMSEELAGVRNPCWECAKVERGTCNPWTPTAQDIPQA